MKFERLNQWMSLVSNLGVILGLVFLGVEISQNNSLMESEARYVRALTRIEANRQIMNNPVLQSAILKAGTNEERTPEENITLQRYAISNFLGVQIAYNDYAAGLIPAESVSAAQLINLIRTADGYSEAWEEARERILSPEFVSWIESQF